MSPFKVQVITNYLVDLTILKTAVVVRLDFVATCLG